MYSGTNVFTSDQIERQHTNLSNLLPESSTLQEIIFSIFNENDELKLFETILDNMLKLSGADYGGLLTYKNDQLILNAVHDANNYIPFTHDFDKIKYALVSESIIKTTLKSGLETIVHDYCTTKKYITDNYLKAKSPNSIFCLPIGNDNETVALIYLEKNTTSCSFSESQLESTRIISAVATSAIIQKRAQSLAHHQEQQKDREISSKALEIYHKNQVLSEVKNELQDLINTSDEALQASLNKIIKSVKNVLSDKQHWENFRNYFDNVHPEFFDCIQRIYPQLTLEDLKYCAFIKIRMSNREIAHLLNINQESVRTHKYRIKKKIKLSKAENLQEHLTMIYNNWFK